MITLSKLPRFMDYLYQHYQELYKHYTGRLVELYPSFDNSENNLAIAEDDETNEEEDNFLMKLWKQFQ